MRWAVRAVLVLGFGVLAAACHQNDTVFLVDTTEDSVDSSPGDGFCNDADGDCSLRAAVMEANALPGVEEIRLVDGEWYELDLTGEGDDEARSGDLDINDGVVIAGDAVVGSVLQEEPLFHVIDAGLVEFDGVDLSGAVGLSIEGASSIVSIRGSDVGAAQWLSLSDGTVFIDGASYGGPDSGPPAIDAVSGQLVITNLSAFYSAQLLSVTDADVQLRYSTLGAQSSDIEVVPTGNGRLRMTGTYLQGGCAAEDAIESLGYNVASAECPAMDQPSDRADLPFFSLGYFGDHGGSVKTFLIQPGSVLHDTGPTSGCDPVDARGVARPFGAACDIGATEIQPSADCEAEGVGVNLRFCDLSDRTFNGSVLRDAEVLGANFFRSNFVDSDLRSVDFSRADLSWNEFTGSDVRDAELHSAYGIRLDDADLSGATLVEVNAFSAVDAKFISSTLDDVFIDDTSGADFSEANFTKATLLNAANASLRNAVVDSYISVTWSPGIDLRGISGAHGDAASVILSFDLTGAFVDGADLSRAEFIGVRSGDVIGTPAALPAGVILTNGHFVARTSNLDGVDLSGEDLSDADFDSGRAHGTNFEGTQMPFSMSQVDVISSNLREASLVGTSSYGGSFLSSDFILTDASDSFFRRAMFDDSRFVGVNFTDADLRDSSFANAQMLWNTFDNTICPSGVNSDDNGGNCDGQFTFGEPQPPGAPVPEEFQGREAEFATFGEREPAD